MLTFILEAALRSLLVALAVWAAIRLLRVQAVLAQKVAWVMVLLAAGVMPLVMHSQWLAFCRAIKIPLHSVHVPEVVARWYGASTGVWTQAPQVRQVVKTGTHTSDRKSVV